VLGRVGLLEQEHGQQEGKEEREVHYLPDEDPMRLAKNGLLLLRFFIEQTYIQAVEIGGASKLILHGEVTRSRGEEQKYPDSEGLLDPLPVLLVFEYKWLLIEDYAHAMQYEAADHDLEAEGGEEAEDRPVAAGVAYEGVSCIDGDGCTRRVRR
jgi:hypothetical protein